MNMHKNARLTPRGRERMVELAASGQTPKAIAEAVGVCPRTVRKWRKRYDNEGIAGLQDRSSRPHRLHRPTPQPIVERSEAPELLEAIEASLDDIALFVDVPVVGAMIAPPRMRRDHRLGTGLTDSVQQHTTVVTSIGEDVRWTKALDQSFGLRHVVCLPRCDDQAYGTAFAVASQVDFGAQTSSGTPQSLGGRPPFPVAACWCARTMVLSSMR